MKINGNIANVDSRKCTGCGACVSSCPLECISMKLNDEGFTYPEIATESCINCNKCISVCSTVGFEKYKIKNAFAAQNINEKDLETSSSGGMFPLFARYWIEQGGYVCAARMLQDFELEHVITNDINVIKEMQGSKYVQSFVYRVYNDMKIILENGSKVLFVGTPCQVSAVRKCFAKYNEQLYCVDLICHGVPSPVFLKKHLKRQYKNLVTDTISFRSKSNCEPTIFAFKLNNNKLVYANKDAYYNAFVKNHSLRESCYECSYVGVERVGDITIGDCATSNCYKPFFPYGSVLSSVFVNTEKGEEIWEAVKNHTKYCSLKLEQEKELNSTLKTKPIRPERRSELYNDLINMEKEDFNQKYVEKSSLIREFKSLLRRIIPLKIKGKIKELLRREN